MIVDARGLSCPQPVLKTKEALEAIDEGIVEVLVDNPASKENVKRFAEKMGCTVEIEEEKDHFRLKIVKGFTCEVPTFPSSNLSGKVVVILSDSMGEEKELGRMLMKAFLSTIKEASQKPKKMLFINKGVLLTTEGSSVIDVLKELEEMGIEILSCGTCLDYFNLKDKLSVGKITNMYDTVEELLSCEGVVRI
ncbi:MAG: sulfurtransferase-like selenium metabolism protein YedF [Deferribacteres bacterium]|nr:sulfurtransferase-like selenium metabolism protein YedF [Deferribacteres bacterium]